MFLDCIGVLRGLNILTGLALAVVASWQLLCYGRLAPLFMLLGIIATGPVEDWLQARFSRTPPSPGDRVSEVIDQLTSWLLLVCLVVAALV